MSIVEEFLDEFEEEILDVLAEEEMERQEGILKYIENKNRFKVYRLKKKIENFWDHVIFIPGYFGTRKTTTAISVVEKLSNDPQYQDVVWIVSSPLRALRNKISSLFKQNVFVMKAHDELVKVVNDQVIEEPLRCHIKRAKAELRQKYGDQIDENKLNMMAYFIGLHRHRKEVRKGNEECWWIEEVSALLNYVRKGYRIIVTTHGLLTVVYSILRGYFRNKGFKYKIVIDEAEQFFDRISRGFPVEELEFIRQLDYRIYSNIKRYFVPDEESKELLFAETELLYEILRNSILISATFPKILLDSVELFLRTMDVRKGIKSDYPIVKVHPMRDSELTSDKVILYDEILSWNETREKLPLIKKWLLLIAEKSIKKYGCFGIVSRNYTLSRELYDFFTKHTGYRVFSDHRDSPDRVKIRRERWRLRIETDKEIIMIMVSGPIKAGIDIVPRSSRVGDVKVIVAFYQGKEDARLYPDIQREMLEGLRFFNEEYDVDEEELQETYKEQKLHAKNLQALHRFSRIRNNEHIYILLDKRWEDAFDEYFSERYWKVMQRIKFNDLGKVFAAAYRII